MPKITKQTRQRQVGVIGNDVIRKFGLKKHCVRDDGHCWLYVVMAKRGLYKATLKRGLARAANPTEAEQIAAESFCFRIENEMNQSYGLNDKKIRIKMPDYDGKRDPDDFLGDYGGMPQWASLSRMMHFTLILWDPRNPMNMKLPNYMFDTLEYTNGKATMSEKNAAEIMQICEPSTIHVAWSNTIDSHFDVYL
jgi:hypothetical protein